MGAAPSKRQSELEFAFKKYELENEKEVQQYEDTKDPIAIMKKNPFLFKVLMASWFSIIAVMYTNRKSFDVLHSELSKKERDRCYKIVSQHIPKKYHAGGEKRKILTGVSFASTAVYVGYTFHDLQISSRIENSRHLKINEILKKHGMEKQENLFETTLLYQIWCSSKSDKNTNSNTSIQEVVANQMSNKTDQVVVPTDKLHCTKRWSDIQHDYPNGDGGIISSKFSQGNGWKHSWR